MRLLHVFHSPNLDNGVDRTTCTLINAMQQAGVASVALVPNDGPVHDWLRQRGITTHIHYLGCCESTAPRSDLRFLRNVATRAEFLTRVIADSRISAVHVNTGHCMDAAIAAGRCGIPAVWHIHSPIDDDFRRYERMFDREEYGAMLSALGSRLIAVSESARDSLAAYVDPAQIDVVPNGVDEEALRLAVDGGSPLREELSLTAERPIVLSVGRISRQKNFSAVARVAAAVHARRPDAVFVIAGPAEQEAATAELDREIHRLGLATVVMRVGSRSDIPAILATSAVFLSTALWEGHPIAALEAMALGTPIAAFACPGIREFVHHEENGLLAHLDDDAALAECVLRLLDDSALSERLTKHAREVVESRYSAARFARAVLDVVSRAHQAMPPSRLASARMSHGLIRATALAEERLLQLEARPSGVWARLSAGRRLIQRLLRAKG